MGVLLYAMLTGSLPFRSAAAARRAPPHKAHTLPVARTGDFNEANEWQEISPEAQDVLHWKAKQGL